MTPGPWPPWELYQAWEAAREEAVEAYRAWCAAGPDAKRERHIVYLAARDREDAAADQWMRAELSEAA